MFGGSGRTDSDHRRKDQESKAELLEIHFLSLLLPEFLYIFFIRNLLCGPKMALSHTPIPLFADSV
jgi:hypothetical protein